MKHLVLFALTTAAALVSTSCGENKVSAHSREVTPLRAYKVDWAEFSNEQRFAAVSEPETQLDLAFQSGGVVTEIYQTNGRALEPGDRVPAGAVLARLRPNEFKARVDQAAAQLADANSGKASAEANVREAEASFAQAQSDFSRAQSLYQVQALTRADLDAARARYDSQQARLAAAKTTVNSYSAKIDAANAAVHESEVPLADTVLRAPFPAVIVSRRIERNSSVAAGTVAYTLADLRRVKISFGIPDTGLPEFTPGVSVRVAVNALPGGPFPGHVIAISPEADPSTRLFHTTALVNNPNGMLRAGLVATVSRELPVQSRALAIPLRALRRLDNQPDGFGVLVIRDGTVQLKPVKLGPTMGSFIAISGGLSSGDLIAEDGGMRLSAGDPVKVVE
jgi:multidrug efflux pump subunit AcrA (membrane-fusion protein)